MLSTLIAVNLSVLNVDFSSVRRNRTMAVEEKVCQGKTAYAMICP